MNIDKILAELPNRDYLSISNLKENVLRALRKDTNNSDAILLDTAIEEELLRRQQSIRNGWAKGKQGDPRCFLEEGKQVAIVRREETHKSTNEGVYSIEVLGEILPDRFRYIADARAAVERKLHLNRPKS